MASTPPPPAKDSSAPPPAPLHPPSSGSAGSAEDEMRTNGSAEGLAKLQSRPRLNDPGVDIKPMLRKLLKKMMFKKHTVHSQYYPFTFNEIAIVIKSVKKVLEKEPPLVTMRAPACVVGDIHGQFIDLVRIFEMFATDSQAGYANIRFVFLGDYVDRGRQSLEVIMSLFICKILFPSQFALLRGNHECRAINKAYGFAAEIRERFLDPKKSVELFEAFNDLFSHLPLACIIGNSIMCMHGGISSKIKSREDIMKVPKPLKDVSTNEIATDLLWADPMIGLAGEVKNKVRGVSVYFGPAVLDQFLAAVNCSTVIRGHQMMMNGFNFFHDHKLITVFSAAAYYPEKPNHGAVAVVGKDSRLGFKIVVPHKYEDYPDSQPKIFRGEHDDANEFDTGFIKVAPGAAKTQESSGGK